MSDNETTPREIGETVLASVHSLDTLPKRIRARVALIVFAIGVKLMPREVMDEVRQ